MLKRKRILMKIFSRRFIVFLIGTFLAPGFVAFAGTIPRCTPGLCTIKNLLATAMQPVGTTMYIWGGGWGKASFDPHITSTRIGVLPQWKEFYEKQDNRYDFRKYRKKIGKLPDPAYIGYGLDCSGFVGWTVYNVMNERDYDASLVNKAKTMARIFANQYGFGTYTDFGEITEIKPGDIVSMSNKSVPSHVYIALGQCSDGSVVTIESTPPGVRMRGTRAMDGTFQSEALNLAQKYMSRYFPQWSQKFPNCLFSLDDYRKDSKMSWNLSGIMKDPENYTKMAPAEILSDLFDEKNDQN